MREGKEVCDKAAQEDKEQADSSPQLLCFKCCIVLSKTQIMVEEGACCCGSSLEAQEHLDTEENTDVLAAL